MKYIAVLLLGLALAQADTRADRFANVFPKNIDLPVPAGLAKGFPSARIVGGEEATPHSIPFQVGLITQFSEGNAFCGGSLIKKNVVLTAAHCVDDATGPTEVILGAHKVREQEDTQKILNSTNRIVHEGWNRLTLTNDIALIILPEEVELNDNIGLVNLPADNCNTFEGNKSRASGWGKDSDSATTISPVLREVELDVLSNGICNIAFLGIIQDSHVCTSGSGGKGTCSGDSGGPLVVDGVQIGIVSFGLSLGCEIGFPAAYTRTSSFLDWIEKNSS